MRGGKAAQDKSQECSQASIEDSWTYSRDCFHSFLMPGACKKDWLSAAWWKLENTFGNEESMTYVDRVVNTESDGKNNIDA